MSKPAKSAGRVAYEQYADAMDWQTATGESMTAWGCLSDGEQRAWERRALEGGIPSGFSPVPIERREARG